MMCLVSLLILIAIPKAILLYFDFEDYLSKQANLCWISLRPHDRSAAGAPEIRPADGSPEDRQQLQSLRCQVGQLDVECSRLRRENADMARALSCIREAAFSVVQK